MIFLVFDIVDGGRPSTESSDPCRLGFTTPNVPDEELSLTLLCFGTDVLGPSLLFKTVCTVFGEFEGSLELPKLEFAIDAN